MKEFYFNAEDSVVVESIIADNWDLVKSQLIDKYDELLSDNGFNHIDITNHPEDDRLINIEVINGIGSTLDRLSMKLGRFITKFIPDVYQSEEIGDLTAKFMAESNVDSFTAKLSTDFEHWYNTSNYYSPDEGELGSSCMNNELDYVDYYNYCEEASIAVLVDENNKLLARCIVWKESNRYYYDRIYHYKPFHEDILKNWMKDQGFENVDNHSLCISVSDTRYYKEYPYMDSFNYLSEDKDTLYNYDPNEPYYKLESTCGELEGNYTCEHCDKEVPYNASECPHCGE